jgi:hypothetical protein
MSAALLAAAPPAPVFRAGATTSNITPPLGADIIGGFVSFPSTNVHDDLHARCLVLDDGQTKLALVVLELLDIDYCETGLEFRQRSPVQPAFLISLAHGYFGYLPTPRQHQWSGYETRLGTSRFEPQASEKMLSALLDMAAEVRAAK